jgi:hypothetical protein
VPSAIQTKAFFLYGESEKSRAIDIRFNAALPMPPKVSVFLIVITNVIVMTNR